MILGSGRFIKETLKKIKDDRMGREEVSHRRELKRHRGIEEILELIAKVYKISQTDIVSGKTSEPKKAAIYLIKKHTGAVNKEIGECFRGLNYSAVAKAYRRFEEELDRSQVLRKRVERINAELSSVKG